MMSVPIKSEFAEEGSCLGCLSNNGNLFEEDQIPSDVYKTYLDLLDKQFTELNSKLLRFCDSCMKFLQNAVKFKEKCISSFEYLTNKTSIIDNFELSDEFPSIKSERPVFVQELPVEAIISEVLLDPIKFPDDEVVKTKEKQIFQCHVCFETFRDKKKFKSHMKREQLKASDVILYCDLCGYSSKRKSTLIAHMQNKHLPKENKKAKVEEEVTCIDCGKICPSMSKYKTHQRIYHSVKTHTCNQCGISYTYGSDLQRHIERKHEVHYKDCPICGKRYKAISLTGHIASVHLQRRNFACDQCDQKFKSSSQLKKHKYTHGKLRPFMCQECGTGYYMNELLRKHYERQHQIIYSQEEIRKLCGKGAGIGGAPLKYVGSNSSVTNS